jgi:PHP family Zn ribbon phosphoesterase
LHDIIATILEVSYQGARRVWEIYNKLVAEFGNEYAVLMDASHDEMSKIVDPTLADAIVRVREGKVKIIPGYDGVYGQLLLFEEDTDRENRLETVDQRSIAEFM